MTTLVIVCGLSFAGKSTLAGVLAQKLGYVEVDVDETKADLHGHNVQDAALTRAHWNRIYAETDRRMLELLDAGRSVVDASRNFTRTERDQARELAVAQGHTVVVVHVTTSEAVARQRWQSNRAHPLRRDVSDADFEDVVSAMAPPTADERPILFHAHDDVETWIALNRERLALKQAAKA